MMLRRVDGDVRARTRPVRVIRLLKRQVSLVPKADVPMFRGAPLGHLNKLGDAALREYAEELVDWAAELDAARRPRG